MVVVMLFAMLYAAGARLKHLATASGGGALILLAIQAVAKPYRMRRLVGFLDPWRTARGAGFQLIQSFIALGAGGGWGQGLGAGARKCSICRKRIPISFSRWSARSSASPARLGRAYFIRDNSFSRDADRARGAATRSRACWPSA